MRTIKRQVWLQSLAPEMEMEYFQLLQKEINQLVTPAGHLVRTSVTKKVNGHVKKGN